MAFMTAKERLERARIQLLMRHSFFGQLALSMPMIPSESAGGQRTTAVDEKGRFYYNEKWIEGMSVTEVMFEVAHEVMHLVQQCLYRFPPGGNKAIWNVAADQVVDTILIDAKLQPSAVSKKMVPESVQKKVRNKTTEQVYYAMLSDQKMQNGCGKLPEGCSFMMPGAGDAGPQGNQKDSHEQNFRGCSSGAGNNQPDPQTVEEWRGKILAAAEVAKSKGELPGFATNFIVELTKPSVTWKSILRHACQSTFKGRYTFRRPSRRSAAIGMRFPARAPTKQGAVIAIDTSGSISDGELRQFITECVQIMKECGAPWLHVFFHDINCYHHEEYTKESIKNIKVTRGGTSHIDVFNKINEVFKDNGKKIGLVIAFTDLYTSFPPEKPNYPVFWGVVPSGESQGVPYGRKVRVELNK